MSRAEDLARGVFAGFQAAVDSWDPEAVVRCCTDDVVYAGTAGYLRGRDELLTYVRRVFELNDEMTWELDDVDVFLDAPGQIGFGARGVIIGRAGETVRRMPFRLSLFAEHQRGRWRIRHFHGSVPIGAYSTPTEAAPEE